MSVDDTEQPASLHMSTDPAWCAAVLLKSNRLVGTLDGTGDSSADRASLFHFNDCLVAMAADLGECDLQHEPLDAMRAVSHLRKTIAVTLREAEQPRRLTRDGPLLTFATFDLLATAAGSCVLDTPAAIHDTATQGMAALRAACEQFAEFLHDVSVPHPLMNTMQSVATQKLVRRALSMQVLTNFFDSSRFACGAKAATESFGASWNAPPIEEHTRAAMGRTDAYMAMRLYTALQTVLAMMMMGVAKHCEESKEGGDRDEWDQTAMGKAVVELRARIGSALAWYDGEKRTQAQERGRTYTAQTPGCVASLQEQAAALATAVAGNALLYDAWVCGLGSAKLFKIPTHNLRWVGYNATYTFWAAVGTATEIRHVHYEGAQHRRVVGVEYAATIVGAMVLGSALDEKYRPLVQLSSSMRTAMEVVAHPASPCSAWPPMSNFYGRDYAETERKVTAKAAREGKDPEGREVGESFGYRLEWMGYLSKLGTGHQVRVQTRTTGMASRVVAAVTSLARAEALATEGASAMPMLSGNAIHHMHGVALAAEPLLDGSALIERGDAAYCRFLHMEAQVGSDDNPTSERAIKGLFVDKIIEKVAPLFKAWSGAALATEPFHEFFAEVWKRFNANMCKQGSPWADKVKRWLAHYAAGTHPSRASGEGKLIHPWRVMHLQRAVARALLEERYGEEKIFPLSSTDKAAARLQRGLLGSLIDVYDYAPWGAHLVRRFCSMDDGHRMAKRKREGVGSTSTPVPRPVPHAPLAPSVGPPGSPSARRAAPVASFD